MARSVIAETTLAGLRPVGIGHRSALDAWDQITAFLRRDESLGEAHANFFAEPVIDRHGRVEWYAPFDSDAAAVPLNQLTNSDREAVLSRAHGIKSAIQDRADGLRSSQADTSRRLGETLAMALSVPEDSDFLYVLDGQPILLNWGMLKDVPSPKLGILDETLRPKPAPPQMATRLAVEPAAPPPVQLATPAASAATEAPQVIHVDRRWGWWGLLWAPLLGSILGALFLLLWGCGINWPFVNSSLSFCPNVTEMAEARRRNVDLLSEIERLERNLSDLPACWQVSPDASPGATPELPPWLGVWPELPELPGLSIPGLPIRSPLRGDRPEIGSDPALDRDPALDPDPAPSSDFDRRRDESGGIAGALTITLIWDGDSDLDLAVICPDGNRIDYANTATCGGRLDVDANRSADAIMENPVENIYWPDGAASPGMYQVYVDNFAGRSHGDRPVPFELMVTIGDNTEEYTGGISNTGPMMLVTDFMIR